MNGIGTALAAIYRKMDQWVNHNEERRYARNALCSDLFRGLFSASDLYPAQAGDIHMNERCLPGGRQ
jgi:hypothetical protein